MTVTRASIVVFVAAFALAFAAVMSWPATAPQRPVDAPTVTVTAVCTTDADCAAWDAYTAENDGNGTVGVLDDGTCPTFTDPQPWINELGVTVCTVELHDA